MNDDIYEQYLERCLGKPIGNCQTEVLIGSDVVAALWTLNQRYRASASALAELPYDAGFEQEANAAIVSYVLQGDDWSGVSMQAWRVLYERHIQAILFFQMQPDEPFIPVPKDLPLRFRPGAALLFGILQLKLPFPLLSKPDLLAWSNTVALPNKRH